LASASARRDSAHQRSWTLSMKPATNPKETRRRRFWSSDEKRRMVGESLAPSASVSKVGAALRRQRQSVWSRSSFPRPYNWRLTSLSLKRGLRSPSDASGPRPGSPLGAPSASPAQSRRPDPESRRRSAVSSSATLRLSPVLDPATTRLSFGVRDHRSAFRSDGRGTKPSHRSR
jgi:hypothetical protein